MENVIKKEHYHNHRQYDEYNTVTYYEYNTEGKKIKEEKDKKADGKPDDAIYYYYKDGKLIKSESGTYTEEGKVNLRFFNTREYDKAGNLLKSSWVDKKTGTLSEALFTYEVIVVPVPGFLPAFH